MKGGMYMTIFLCIILILGSVFCDTIEIYRAEENLSMYSGSYALLDGDSGRVLVGKEETIPMANASTTKILTCIVALENCEIDEVVSISKNAASQPKVHLGMKEGEQYSLKDMLYALMLESYNDCAVAIAEHVAGTTENFAKMMNEKAVEIGCVDTYFITPNGLDAEDEVSFHHTTAADLCKIMAYCTWESPKKEQFLQITQARNYASYVNRNAFLNQMDGVLSGKTGFTNKAGYCYVAAMEVNGEKYCIALLACGWPNNKNYKWKDARTLFEYGMENYHIQQVTINATKEQIKVDGYIAQANFEKLNTEDYLELHSEEHEYQLLMSEKDRIETEVVLYTDTKLPIHKGQTLGICNIYLNDILMDSFPLKTDEDAHIWGWKDIFYTIFYRFLTFC